jgi:type II secretory ATPase GspE/PulE/Tfp pilus assembly ATPase PilB-like protein
VQRLLDIGVDPGLIASSVNCFVSQRLVRRVCPDCAEAYEAGPAERAELGAEGARGKLVLRRATGCPECGGTGYRGRVGIFEALTMTDEVGALVGAPTRELQAKAVEHGMLTLRDDGMRLCREGVTTLAEVRRVVGDRIAAGTSPTTERRTRTRRTTTRRSSDLRAV